jgi:hypothetical protein
MTRTLVTLGIVLALAIVGIGAVLLRTKEVAKTSSHAAGLSDASVSAPSGTHETVIRPAPRPRPIATDVRDPMGTAVTLDCRACHQLRPPNKQTRQAADLTDFHQGLAYQHGNLACVACHDPGDGYSTLRLADGSALAFGDSIQLCAQCHGTQYRDYQRGAHGGMTGHWDLQRGGRTRNHCQHCHDPHVPKFPKVHPVFGPRDRFPPAQESSAHE